MRKLLATGTLAGALAVGGITGAILMSSPSAALAQDPASSAAPAASTAPGTPTTPNAGGRQGDPNGGPGGFGGPGGRQTIEAVSDDSVVAKAIGITEADLATAEQSSQTIAAIAKAHNVDLQKVIDALVADSQSELDAAVKAGTLTQAQADAQKANLTQQATDRVNGTGHGPGGPGGRGGHGGFGQGPNETVSDASVVAGVIGISEADLTTAVNNGQTIAAIAKAHNVDVQKVIDALVADSQSELDDAVKAGTLTQAQADAQKANLTQHATDQVNGAMSGGRGHDGSAPNSTTPPAASPSTSGSSN